MTSLGHEEGREPVWVIAEPEARHAVRPINRSSGVFAGENEQPAEGLGVEEEKEGIKTGSRSPGDATGWYHGQRQGSRVAPVVKNPPASAGDTGEAGRIPGSGRLPGEGHGKATHSSILAC